MGAEGLGGTVDPSVIAPAARMFRTGLAATLTAVLAASLGLSGAAAAPKPAAKPATTSNAPSLPAAASPGAVGKVIGSDDAEAKARDDAEPPEDDAPPLSEIRPSL